MKNNIFIHKTSEVSTNASVGKNSKIWHFSHIRENVTIGDNVSIGQNVYIDRGVKIGNNCKIQNNVSIYNGVIIGNNVFVGPSVVFTNDIYPEVENWSDDKIIKTLICDGVSIGANSTILCGITLFENCLIGAGSVVTKNIQKNMIAYGNPAIEVKNRH